MAIIGKIRSKSGLLVGIVGIALLTFILSDYQRMFGFSDGDYGIGTIFGEKVNPDLYSNLSLKVYDQDKAQSEQNGQPFDEQKGDQAYDKAWNFIVDSTILAKEYEALGISVSDRELDAYLMATNGFSVLSDLGQFFTDSVTNTITEESTIRGRQKLKTTIDQLKNNKEAQAQQQWVSTKLYYTQRRKQEKYFALLNQGVYVTKLEAEMDYYGSQEKKSIQFVVKRYSEIDDANIKVSEDELKSYYEEHKNESKYKVRNPSREVKVFDVVIAPSRKDSTDVKTTMRDLKNKFQTSENDSLFVMTNSDIKNYFSDKRATAVPAFHKKADRYQSYPVELDTIFKKSSIGDVVGPYWNKENVLLSKVIGFTPDRLKARHLLISTSGITDKKLLDAKKKTADSLLKVINKDNFKDLVGKYTEDPGSKATGGEYDDFLEGDMVKEFGGFCATQPIGKIGMVKTDFGYHIIEVLDRGTSKFPVLATVSKVFKASETTIYEKESEVNRILYKLDAKISKATDPAKKVELFDTILRRENYFAGPITIEDNSPKVYGFTTSMAADKILMLAYAKEAAVGDLTSGPIKDKDKYVLGMITSIKEEGTPKFEDVREQMRRELIEEKKAKRLTNLMKGKSVKALSKKFSVPVLMAEVAFNNPSIQDAGYEPEIVGGLFSKLVKDGSRTKPLKGKMGVYVIQIMKTVKAPANNNYKTEREQLLANLKNSIQGQAIGALRKTANVIDNRKLNALRLRL